MVRIGGRSRNISDHEAALKSDLTHKSTSTSYIETKQKLWVLTKRQDWGSVSVKSSRGQNPSLLVLLNHYQMLLKIEPSNKLLRFMKH